MLELDAQGAHSAAPVFGMLSQNFPSFGLKMHCSMPLARILWPFGSLPSNLIFWITWKVSALMKVMKLPKVSSLAIKTTRDFGS
jgi:hypothetical protein